MESDNAKVLGWGTIIAILIAVGVAVGLLLGLMRWLFGLSPRVLGAGVGAAVGVVGATLVARWRVALARQNNS